MGSRGLSETYDTIRDEVSEILELLDAIWSAELSFLQRLWLRYSPPAFMLHLDRGSKRGEAVLRRRASPDLLAHRLFPLLEAPYLVEALARHIRSEHGLTAEQAEALKELHEAVDEQERTVSSTLRMRSGVGAVITVIALVASQVPKETLALFGLGDRGYGVYRLMLFQLLVLGVGIFLLGGYFHELMVRFVRASERQEDAAPVVVEVPWKHLSYLLRLVLLECALVEHFPAEDDRDEQPSPAAAAAADPSAAGQQ